MKPLFILIFLLFSSVSIIAQNDLETLIREIEQKEVEAVLSKDTALLHTMWSKDLTVNSPFNRIVKPGTTTVDRPVITDLNYSSFQRNIEQVIIKESVIITMGNEEVVLKEANGTPGRTINRRYTNIWMKEDNQWKIIARHANEIK